MRYILILLISLIIYGCMAQYPSLNYMNYYNNRYGQTKKDTGEIFRFYGMPTQFHPQIKIQWYCDTTPIKIYNNLDTFEIPQLSDIHVISWGSYNNSNYVVMSIIDNDTSIYVSGDSLTAIKLLFKAWHDATQFDSSKFYYEKQNYWQKKMNKESRRLDRLKTPQISQKLLDYQDSLIHYQLLLLKKIKNGSNKMDK